MGDTSMNVEDIVKLSNHKIGKLTRDNLETAFKSVVAVIKQPKEDLGSLLQSFQIENRQHFDKLNQRLDTIAESVKAEIREEFNPQLQQVKTDQSDLKAIVERQQTYIEQLDVAQRADKVVITGMTEDTPLTYQNKTADTDEEKCALLLSMLNCEEVELQDMCRLGKQRPNAVRPLKLTLTKPSDRVVLLEEAPLLQSQPPPFKSIRLKKDTHPAVRREWARLHAALKEEKDKPENIGTNVVLDYKNRQLLRNDDVIDSFRNPFM